MRCAVCKMDPYNHNFFARRASGETHAFQEEATPASAPETSKRCEQWGHEPLCKCQNKQGERCLQCNGQRCDYSDADSHCPFCHGHGAVPPPCDRCDATDTETRLDSASGIRTCVDFAACRVRLNLETVWIVVRKTSIDSVWMNSALAAARGADLDGEWEVQNHPLRRWMHE